MVREGGEVTQKVRGVSHCGDVSYFVTVLETDALGSAACGCGTWEGPGGAAEVAVHLLNLYSPEKWLRKAPEPDCLNSSLVPVTSWWSDISFCASVSSAVK